MVSLVKAGSLEEHITEKEKLPFPPEAQPILPNIFAAKAPYSNPPSALPVNRSALLATGLRNAYGFPILKGRGSLPARKLKGAQPRGSVKSSTLHLAVAAVGDELPRPCMQTSGEPEPQAGQKPEQMQAEAEALSMRAKHDLQEDPRGGLHG